MLSLAAVVVALCLSLPVKIFVASVPLEIHNNTTLLLPSDDIAVGTSLVNTTWVCHKFEWDERPRTDEALP